MRPLLIVISAPSGAGKSTLCDRLLAERSDIVYSISCTTRKPRGDEAPGVDYFFLTEQQFDTDVKAGRFLEHAVVHGNKYGTPRSMVADAMHSGKSVIMDIDVQGAAIIRDSGLADAAFIFISPPGLAELERRLRGRAQDAEETILLRLKNAEMEMQAIGNYDYLIVNERLEEAARVLEAIILAERAKMRRLPSGLPAQQQGGL